MSETEVIIMKFELEKQELMKDVYLMNRKINELENIISREKDKMKKINKLFSVDKVVNAAMLHVQYDSEKVIKITREIGIIRTLITKIGIQIEAVDEKIKVIKEEVLKNMKEEDVVKNRKEEYERLDMKIIREGGK